MRKIDEEISNAFHSHRRLTKNNTFTDGQAVWLFGNKIVERRNGQIWISAAGWPTTTTKSRINGILGHRGRLFTKKGELYLHSKYSSQSGVIDPDSWISVGE